MIASDHYVKHALELPMAAVPGATFALNHGWGDLQLHPHDVARIGHLCLNGGEWNGQRVVSRRWVDEATQRHISTGEDGTGYRDKRWNLTG